MLKHIYIAIFIIFLFGCIQVEYNHTQFSDGSAVVSYKTDMSSLFSLLESYGGSYGSSTSSLSKLNELCSSYNLENGATCEQESGIITLSKRYSTEDAFYKFEVKDEFFVKKYRLSIDELPTIIQNYSLDSLYGSSGSSYNSDYYKGLFGSDYQLSSKKSSASASLLKVYGVTSNYTVTMPGTVTKAELGKIDGSKVTFDVFELMQKGKPIIVESEEYSVFSLIIVFVLFLVVAGFAVLFFRQKEEEPPVM